MRGAEIISAFLEHSPFVGHLEMELRSIEDDRAVLAMPFREEVVTIGDVVHGGAVSALIDTAAMTAAWSAIESTSSPRREPRWGLRSTSSPRLAGRTCLPTRGSSGAAPVSASAR